MLLLDLTAAFHMDECGLLTHRLAGVGIQEIALEWLSSFLHSQGERMVFGEELSQQCQQKCGVSQGEILSLLLFNMYMHPLAQIVWRYS